MRTQWLNQLFLFRIFFSALSIGLTLFRTFSMSNTMKLLICMIAVSIGNHTTIAMVHAPGFVPVDNQPPDRNNAMIATIIALSLFALSVLIAKNRCRKGRLSPAPEPDSHEVPDDECSINPDIRAYIKMETAPHRICQGADLNDPSLREFIAWLQSGVTNPNAYEAGGADSQPFKRSIVSHRPSARTRRGYIRNAESFLATFYPEMDITPAAFASAMRRCDIHPNVVHRSVASPHAAVYVRHQPKHTSRAEKTRNRKHHNMNQRYVDASAYTADVSSRAESIRTDVTFAPTDLNPGAEQRFVRRNLRFQRKYRVLDEAAKPPVNCLLYTSPSPRDKRQSRMPSSA